MPATNLPTDVQFPGMSRLAGYYGGRKDYEDILATNHKRMGVLENRLKSACSIIDDPRDLYGLENTADFVDHATKTSTGKVSAMKDRYINLKDKLKEIETNGAKALDINTRRSELQVALDELRELAGDVFIDVDITSSPSCVDRLVNFKKKGRNGRRRMGR